MKAIGMQIILTTDANINATTCNVFENPIMHALPLYDQIVCTGFDLFKEHVSCVITRRFNLNEIILTTHANMLMQAYAQCLL